MTQQVAHARVIFTSSNVNVDNSSFGLTFEATGSDTALDFTDSETPTTAVTTFVNGFATLISDAISRSTNATLIEWYDVTANLNGSPAGAPFRTDAFTLGASSGAESMPPGLAACVSYRRAYGTDSEHGVSAAIPTGDRAVDEGAPSTHTGITKPRARDRGRLFIGPINLSMLASSAQDGEMAPGAVTTIESAVNGLANTKNALSHNQFNWVQWSRQNASVANVAFYSMPYGISYQRRRADEQLTRVSSWTAVH